MADALPPRRGKGGRPPGDPAAVRRATIGVRVSAAEYTALRTKAVQMGMSPAQWLRTAALTRRLPSPPVPPVNREQYVALGRLATNLNQLTRLANAGQLVVIHDRLLQRLTAEVRRLRLALLGTARKRRLGGAHHCRGRGADGTARKRELALSAREFRRRVAG